MALPASGTITAFKAFVDAEAAKKGRVAPNNVTAFKNGVKIGAVNENFWDFATANGLKPVQDAEVLKK